MVAAVYNVIVLSSLCLCSRCGSIFPDNEEQNLIDLVENVMDCRKVPGLALTVVKDEEVWSKGFGSANLVQNTPVTDKTLFLIGSVAKAFTMVLLGSLIKDTKYTFSTKLIDIEGVNLEFIDANITRDATLADLLSHQTGLSPITDYGFIAGYPEQADREFLSRRAKYIPELKPFRSTFVYNNMMYMILGHITEILGKDTWENLMMSRIFEPIGMTSSKVMTSSDDLHNGDVAKPYLYRDGVLSDGNSSIYKITPLEPAGSIMSNGADMAKWMTFLLNKATTSNGDQLLRESDINAAFQGVIDLSLAYSLQNLKQPTFPIDDVTDAYGLGFFTSTYRGRRRLWHSGGLFSYVSLMWLFPEQKIGIFGNVNGPGTPKVSTLALQNILSYSADFAFGLEPWLNLQTTCSFPSPWRNTTVFNIPPPKKYTAENITDYVGTYGNIILPDTKIMVREETDKEDHLWLEMNRIKGELLPTAYEDMFSLKLEEPWEFAVERFVNENYTITHPLRFKRNEENIVVGFNVTLHSANDIMTYQKGITFMQAGALMSPQSDEVTNAAHTVDYTFVLLLMIWLILVRFAISRL